MVLRRYTRPSDGTIPIQALLYDDEELLASQDNCGIYDGSQKSPEHQNGTIHITSHRLFYIDAHRPGARSFELDLSWIGQTEYYAGLFKSSPKITCHLSGEAIASGSADTGGAHAQFDSWECEVCAYRNPPGLSPTAARICALCGVPRTAVPTPTNSGSSHHLSTSLPSSVLSSSTNLVPELLSPAGHKQAIPCPACTFLNHPYLRKCEICSTDLPQSTGAYRSAPSSRPITPDPDDDDDSAKMIKVSIRRGGEKHLYAVLKRSLKTKAWESSNPHPASLTAANSTNSEYGTPGRSGISGILRTVETSAKGRETHMRDALQDLEALMVKAKDMVKLAAELNEKLTAAAAAATAAQRGAGSGSGLGQALTVAEPEEATFIRSSLSQLGVQLTNTPVTLDMMEDERAWYSELARELARVLQGPPHSSKDDIITSGMMKDRGIIALDEVWGGWNRARGVALIPPPTFLQVLPHLPAHSSPTIRHRAFASGLNVLHTPPYTAAAFAARLSSLLVMSGPRTTLEIAKEEDLTVALVSEMIDAVEQDSGICRDDSSAAIVGGDVGTGVEVRWWSNIFVGYIWDGQE
ncbi:vacuolar protein sorting-associated protein 36 [Pholiota conissans]|uniref:Vacuolar protein-sorting-associated protein 36 n=1 Tax=Pholiota conissans TaxID=109636 RepID=A0A9P5ZCB1_9AGAR|nr:vacuolar protein sorting-associated protein 36 [Pholiota conissans]